MTPKTIMIGASLGSAALLLGAFGFQYIGGLAPCQMCIWQRIPHAVAAVLPALLLFSVVWTGVIGALTMGASVGLGLLHVGVEKAWWQGPGGCSAGNLSDLTPEQALEALMAAPLVSCTDVAWAFAGISMAGWNGILSLALLAVWGVAVVRARTA